MIVDYILVGQGLAGSVLAYQLIKRGKRIVVFNQTDKNKSSIVAAGIFNPITGRRFVKTWEAELLFPYLRDFYSEIENDLQINFLHSFPVFRPFTSIEEQNELIAKSTSDLLGPYIEKIQTDPLNESILKNEFGGVFINQSGFVDIEKLIQSINEMLIKKGLIKEEKFNESSLITKPGTVIYEQISARKLIYCDGPEAASNLYFNWLPFQLVKGELIYVEMDGSLNYIYNRSIFILPYSRNLFKVGATYDWDNLDTNITENAKNYLEKKLKGILNVNFKTVKQLAGIRPATRDRRPFIGTHPEIREIAIFNGLGSKGVSIAPYYADQFIDHLENGKMLDREVNIERYTSLYT